jgi:hypothetical protein
MSTLKDEVAFAEISSFVYFLISEQAGRDISTDCRSSHCLHSGTTCGMTLTYRRIILGTIVQELNLSKG